MTDDEPPPGWGTESLRQRNRARKKRVIHLEGMRLFSERGYESTTISDIAEAASVAPRTVSLYYPAKLDIALASTSEAADRLLTAMREADPGTPLEQIVVDWLEFEIANADPTVWELRGVMFASNPSLRHADSPSQQAVGRAASELLARDLGVPLGHPAVSLAEGALSGVLTSFVIAAAHHERRGLVTLTAAAVHGVLAALRQTVQEKVDHERG